MRKERSCGVIVFHRDHEGNVQFLLVQGYGNYWGFPKGRAEGNETSRDTALRELKEETGITSVHLLPHTRFKESYIIHKKRKTNVSKTITYFVGEVFSKDAKRQRSEIKQLAWFDLEHAKQRVVPDKKEILDKVASLIHEGT